MDNTRTNDLYNFVDFLMHFFVSRELFIANTLSRHFSWSENIMFVEDLEECSRYVESRSDSMGSSDRYSYKAEESALRRKKHTVSSSISDVVLRLLTLISVDRYFHPRYDHPCCSCNSLFEEKSRIHRAKGFR